MSLTGCLKKAGSALRAQDKSAILAGSRQYRASGMTPDQAAIKAIDDQLAVLSELIDKAEGNGLVAPTRQDILNQQQRKVEAEKSEVKAKADAEKKAKNEREAAEIKQAGANAADRFVLGGNAEDELSGQGGMFNDSIVETKATLDANNVGGKERLDVVKDVKSGALTVDEVKEAYPSKIDDFGEKLEGARKDAVPTLSTELTDEVLATEPLSKVWPADEYLSYDDKFVSAVAFAARAEVPAKPRVDYKIKRWVQNVKMVRALAQRVAEGKTTPAQMREALKASRGLDSFAAKVALLEAIDREQWGRIGKVGEYPNAYRYLNDGSKQATPLVSVQVDDKENRFDASNVADVIEQVNGLLGNEVQGKKMAFEVRGNGASYSINKKGDKEYRKLKTFPTAKDALAYRDSNYDDLVAAWEGVKERDNVKERDVRSTENRPRTAADYRNGKDVTPEQFQETFGFRGGQFGNWVSDGAGTKDRQGMLNQAYDAFMDLSEILKIPPKAISLNGTLGISFGARGTGWASAHFEPGNLVVNLTKTRGAGALAHEWFHALDNYFARERGGEVAIKPGMNAQQAYRESNYITYRPEPLYVHISQRSKMTKAALEADRAKSPNSNYLKPENWKLDPAHPTGVRPEVERAFAELVEALNASPMAARARSIDKTADAYWSQIIERGARSFENYILNKMAEKGYSNDYLANVTPVQDFPRSKERYPYLMPEEVAPVAEAFDNLFATVDTKQTEQGVAMFARKPFDAEAFSRMFESPSAMSITEVQSAANKLSANWKSGPAIKVVASTEELPVPAPTDARGLIHNGTAYIVARNHTDRDGVARTLGHEAIGHYGLWRMLGDEGTRQFQRNLQLALKSGNVPLTKLSEKVRRLYVDSNGGFNLNTADEANEIAAFAVEDAIDTATGEFKPGFGLLKSVYAKVADFLRSLGIMVKFTNIELQGMLVSAMRGLKTGRKLDGGGQSLMATGRARGESAEFNALRAISENDELFALPKSDKTTIEGITDDANFGLKVTKSRDAVGRDVYNFTTPDGKDATISVRAYNPYATGDAPTLYGYKMVDGEMTELVTERPGTNPQDVPPTDDVWVDVSRLKVGGAGAHIYNIAETYARNTGKLFIGDPAGLSDEALRRRTEQMLSSALKFGTTEHLAPHPRQVKGDAALGVPPLKWTYGDDLGNIESLIQTSIENYRDANPFTFEPSTGRFLDSEGNELDGDAISLIVQGTGLGEKGAGRTTLQRGAVFESLVREGRGTSGGTGRRAGLLEGLVGLARQYGPSTRKIFYARDGRRVDQTPDIRFSSKPDNSIRSSLDVRDVDKFISRVNARLPADGAGVSLARTFEDLPDSVQQAANDAGVTPASFRGVTMAQGKVYIVQDTHSSMAELEATVLHELYGHVGLRSLFGPEITRRMNKLYLALGESRFKELADKYGLNLDAYQDIAGKQADQASQKIVTRTGGRPELRNAILAEELLAHMAESETGTLRQQAREIIGAIRNWLRENGFTALADINEFDLAHILKMGRQAMESKQPFVNLPMFARSNQAEAASEKEGVKPALSPWRDVTGRLQFAPGVWLYERLGEAAGPLLAKAGMKAASPELRHILRGMKVDVAKAQETAAAVAVETNKMSAAEREMVSDLIEQELQAGTIPPQHAVRLAAMINESMESQSNELVRLGMLTKDAADKWRGQYLPRFYKSKLTQQAADSWADMMRGVLFRPSALKGIKGKHLKGRGLYETIPESQLADWESLGWELRDPDYNPALTTLDGTVQVWRDFTRQERDKMGEIRDAGFRFVMGYMQTQKDIALGRMFEQLAGSITLSSRLETEAFSVQVPESKVAGTKAKVYGLMAGRWVSPETMSQLSAIEESQSEALQMYRKAMGLWKEGKTALNPVAHVNNIVSNLSMAHFAGVGYHRADKYMAAIKDFATKSGRILEAKEAGLFVGTLSEAELMNTLPEELKLLAQQQEATSTKVGRSAFNLMTFFLRKPMGVAYGAEDTFFRYLIYKDARDQGLEAAEAVDYAQKYIFTYDDLPKGARRIRDFGIPFFSYTYKAVPALLHTALTHPLRMAAPAAVLWTINAAAYAIAAGDDDDSWDEKLKLYLTDEAYRAKVREKEKLEREHLPPWMKGTTALMTPKTLRLGMDEVTKLPLFIDISRLIPGGDMFDVSPNAGGIPLPQPITPSHPLFTTAVAMLGNKDLFLGKELVDSNDTRSEATNKRLAWLWTQMTPAITAGNYHWQRGMNALAQANGGEITWLPDMLGGDATGIGRDGNPVQPGLAAMQTFGIKVRPIDLDTAEVIDGNMKNKMIRDIDGEMKKLQRYAGKGAISDRTLDKEIEKAQIKRDRLRDGLTVDGDKKD